MKNSKTTKMSNRITAMLVIIVMVFTTLTSCVSINESDLEAFNNAENSVFAKDDTDAEETTEAPEKQDAEAEKQDAEAEKQDAEAEKQNAEAEKQNAEAEKQNAEAEKQDAEDEKRADAAEKRADAAEKRADAAYALAETFKAKLAAEHPIIVKNDDIWVHIDDFLNAPNGVGAIIKSENGYAMRATSGVHVRIYDDMTFDNSFLVENFDLPMLQKYTIVLTNDEGKTAFTASFGNYSWANGGLFTDYCTSQFASELTSMPKNGKSGEQFFVLLSECAVVTYSDGEYRFAIYAGDFESNPTPTPTPTVEPEVVVKEIEKTVVETKTEKVNYCGRCGQLIENCICEPEVKVVEKVVEVEVPVEKVVEKVVEVPGETKTEYIYVPVPTPTEPDNNPDRPDDDDFNTPENNPDRDDDGDFDNGPADMDPDNNPVGDDDFGDDEGPADMNNNDKGPADMDPDNNPVGDDDFGDDEGPADMNNNSNTNSNDGPADMNGSSDNGPADMNNINNYTNSEVAGNNNDAPENSYASGDDIF